SSTSTSKVAKRPTKAAGSTKKISPYNKFMKANLAEYKKKNPNVSHKEAFAGVAAMWKTAAENPKNAIAAK
ncbi:hypothetical protein FB639_005603, partial [Coemansia asiatica]